MVTVNRADLEAVLNTYGSEYAPTPDDFDAHRRLCAVVLGE